MTRRPPLYRHVTSGAAGLQSARQRLRAWLFSTWQRAALGPFGLGAFAQQAPWIGWFTIPREEGALALAEVGVLFLMFAIGLDLSVGRMWAMRRWVFGAGTAQVVVCSSPSACRLAVRNPPQTAVMLGLVLVLVDCDQIQLLAASASSAQLGRATFSVLLFQDLAVVPVMILAQALGKGTDALLPALGLSLLKAVAAIVIIYGVGSRVVRPVFRQMASGRQPDVLMALTVLCALGIASLTQLAGLSMALGALLAGLVLAETEYRHEIEVMIEPFRQLLMGLFFLSVGMNIDLMAIVRDPLWLPLSVLGLFAIKALLTAGVLVLHGLPRATALEAGLMLGQGGEFAFIVIGVALASGLLPDPTARFMMLVVGISMMITPLAASLGRTLAGRLSARGQAAVADAMPDLPSLQDHVVIAGFGRVGRLVAEILEQRQIPWAALDNDAAAAGEHHRRGLPVFVGDAGRAELLKALRVQSASAAVLTMDDAPAALRAVRAIRAAAPDLPILAPRPRSAHAGALIEAGATTVSPATLEAGLQLAGAVTEHGGIPREAVQVLLDQQRALRMAAIPVPSHAALPRD
jgi:CPA2 family monovalent cation:H+ antiporter-2